MRKLSSLLLVLMLVVGFATLANAADKVELEMWTFVTAHADYYQAKAEEFNEMHPEMDFVLNIQTYPYQQMHDKLNIALQTGMGAPDISDIEIAKFPGILGSGASSLVDITNAVDEYMDGLVEARFAPYSLDGKIYGIPTHIGTGVIYYNKALFEEAGVNPDDIKTWADYVEAGKKLTKDTDGDGKIDQWMVGVPNGSFWPFNMMSRQFGSNIFSKDGEVIVDRPENVKVLQFMQDLVYKYEIAKTITDYHDNNFYAEMNSGTFASVLPMPQWYMIRFTEFMPDLAGNILVRPEPLWEGEDVTQSAMGGGTGTAITAQCDNVEVAEDFLAYAKLTPEAGVEIWTRLGFDPIQKGAYDNPELFKPLPYFNNEVVMNTVKDLQPELQPLYLTKLYPMARNVMEEDVVFGAIEEQGNVEQLLKDAADTLRAEQ